MKRIGVAVVLLIISAGLCIYEQYTVEETYKVATALIDTALEEAEKGNYNEYAEAMSELGEYWNRKYKSLKVMIDHGSIDEVSVMFKEFEEMIEGFGWSVIDVFNVKYETYVLIDTQSIPLFVSYHPSTDDNNLSNIRLSICEMIAVYSGRSPYQVHRLTELLDKVDRFKYKGADRLKGV